MFILNVEREFDLKINNYAAAEVRERGRSQSKTSLKYNVKLKNLHVRRNPVPAFLHQRGSSLRGAQPSLPPPLSRGSTRVDFMPRNMRWMWASCGRCVPVDTYGSSEALGKLAEGRRCDICFFSVIFKALLSLAVSLPPGCT